MKELLRFTSDLEKCPYLPDRSARLHYRFVAGLTPHEYSRELARGSRRFGSALFEPRCPGCRECVGIRIPVQGFRPSRSQRRVLRKNRDLRVVRQEPRVDDERLALYRIYHEERTTVRGWPPSEADPKEYYETFVRNAAPTVEVCYRAGERLIGVSYVGEASDALNAIYAFFDPREYRRSPGTFNVLSLIETARSAGRRYLYLGYRVVGCPSMSYKVRFRPHEILVEGRWTPVEEG